MADDTDPNTDPNAGHVYNEDMDLNQNGIPDRLEPDGNPSGGGFSSEPEDYHLTVPSPSEEPSLDYSSAFHDNSIIDRETREDSAQVAATIDVSSTNDDYSDETREAAAKAEKIAAEQDAKPHGSTNQAHTSNPGTNPETSTTPNQEGKTDKAKEKTLTPEQRSKRLAKIRRAQYHKSSFIKELSQAPKMNKPHDPAAEILPIVAKGFYGGFRRYYEDRKAHILSEKRNKLETEIRDENDANRKFDRRDASFAKDSSHSKERDKPKRDGETTGAKPEGETSDASMKGGAAQTDKEAKTSEATAKEQPAATSADHIRTTSKHAAPANDDPNPAHMAKVENVAEKNAPEGRAPDIAASTPPEQAKPSKSAGTEAPAPQPKAPEASQSAQAPAEQPSPQAGQGRGVVGPGAANSNVAAGDAGNAVAPGIGSAATAAGMPGNQRAVDVAATPQPPTEAKSVDKAPSPPTKAGITQMPSGTRQRLTLGNPQPQTAFKLREAQQPGAKPGKLMEAAAAIAAANPSGAKKPVVTKGPTAPMMQRPKTIGIGMQTAQVIIAQNKERAANREVPQVRAPKKDNGFSR